MPFNVTKSFVLFFIVAVTGTLSAAEIHWVKPQSSDAPEKVVVRHVENLNPPSSETSTDWKSWLNVFVELEETSQNAPQSILGSYSKSGSEIIFTPRFPFSDRVAYRAEFIRLDKNIRLISKWQPNPNSKFPSTEVSNIYPTSKILPENLLKFYLTFSNPMSGGHVYDYIHLYDEKDQEVELPFLELSEELWDTSMQRLTLFIDPGRIKRGVKPLEDIGPSLEAGKQFRLVINKNWKDASGSPLKNEIEKEFRVALPDRQSIAPNTWEIRIPKVGSLQALVIKFGEPLDYALAQRVIELLSADGHRLEGTNKLQANETELHFIANTAWSKGNYRIRIRTLLEDLAGNNVGKPFEVDVFDKVEKRIQSKYVERIFTIQ
jgi:hypothetical protein